MAVGGEDTTPGSAVERLTGPGGAFELVVEAVHGVPTPVFSHRGRSLSRLLGDSRAHGDRDYLVTRDRRISYREHEAMARSLARALHDEYGVRRGDRVGIAAANGPEWIVTFWAVVSLGAVVVGYNAWWSAPELRYALDHTRPHVVVADRKRAALVGDAVPVVGVEDDLARMVESWAAHPALPEVAVDEDDPAVVLYTSGTSGRPKGAVHSHRSLLSIVEFHRLNEAVAAATGDRVEAPQRRHLLTMPLFHVASLHNLAVPALASGSAVVVHQGAFEAGAVLRLVERERVTDWGAVPTMALRLLEHPDLGRYDTSSVRAFALASAPSAPDLKERLRSALPFASTLVDSYGLTEAGTAVTVAGAADLAQAPTTVGRPVPGVRLEVRGPLGEPVAPGIEGEICVLSAYTMTGYWRDPAATEGALGQDRWLRTGDLGLLDEEGRLHLTTRRSDLILRGGENVYPAEVEAALLGHPDVDECAVHGVPHPDLGEEVAVVVVSRRPDHGALERELSSWLTGSLARHKQPTRWRITSEPLPRNASGKLQRTRVRL